MIVFHLQSHFFSSIYKKTYLLTDRHLTFYININLSDYCGKEQQQLKRLTFIFICIKI